MASYFEAVAPTNTMANMASTAPTRATIAGRFEAISSSMIAPIMVWFVGKGQEISEGVLKYSKENDNFFFLIAALRIYNGSNQKINKNTLCMH